MALVFPGEGALWQCGKDQEKGAGKCRKAAMGKPGFVGHGEKYTFPAQARQALVAERPGLHAGGLGTKVIALQQHLARVLRHRVTDLRRSRDLAIQ